MPFELIYTSKMKLIEITALHALAYIALFVSWDTISYAEVSCFLSNTNLVDRQSLSRISS